MENQKQEKDKKKDEKLDHGSSKPTENPGTSSNNNPQVSIFLYIFW
jgi:hypothetical protein